MPTIRLNQGSLDDWARRAIEATRQAVDEISRTHAGRPRAEVEQALRDRLREIGVEPGKDFGDLVRRISSSRKPAR